jgi:hypothetical protein
LRGSMPTSTPRDVSHECSSHSPRARR